MCVHGDQGRVSHRTTRELVNCNVITGKSDPFDKCWFHNTFSYQSHLPLYDIF